MTAILCLVYILCSEQVSPVPYWSSRKPVVIAQSKGWVPFLTINQSPTGLQGNLWSLLSLKAGFPSCQSTSK